MKQNQKRILMAVSAIIVGMLVYPPFQVIAPNGAVYNMGYNWLIDPPMRSYITATVNVSMLLIQWIGVLVVGGIAFFLAKNPKKEPQLFSDGTNHSAAEQPHHNLELSFDNQSAVETDVTKTDNEGHVDSKLTQLSHRSEKDFSKKNIQVLRPALIASIIGFILGVSYCRPPATLDGMGALALCLLVGIGYSLMAFFIVAIWQGLRLYFTKPTAKESDPGYKFGFFSPIVSEDDAWSAIKGNSWGIVLLTGLSSILAIYVGNNIVPGLVGMALIVGLVLIVYHRKSRIAAVGLLFLSVAVLIATGHNRFFGGQGGQNMMMAFFMVCASVRIVLATCRLQSFNSSQRDGATSETKGSSISSHNHGLSHNNQSDDSYDVERIVFSKKSIKLVFLSAAIVISFGTTIFYFFKNSTSDKIIYSKMNEILNDFEKETNLNKNDIHADEIKKNTPEKISEKITSLFNNNDFNGVMLEAENGNYLYDSSNIIGIACFKLNKFDKALYYFLEAEKYYPHDPSIKCNIGNAYLKLNKIASSLAKFVESINIDINNTDAKKGIFYIENNVNFGYFGYKREKVDVEFQKLETSKVFEFFEKIIGQKIIYKGDMNKKTTLKLNNIPVDLVFSVVLKLNNLDISTEKNTIYIYNNR